MLIRTMVLLTVGTMFGGLWASALQEVQETRPVKPPRVEVVFVLDTTGSMGNLIDAAKRKIWSIATAIERGKPKPELHVGLVEYRDQKEAYVTRVTGLTENLDKIHGELATMKAEGGGDHPEDVRQGLHDALTKIEWSKDKSTLKIIFLVGDAPPHLDYKNVPTVEDLCETAAKAEVVINTIRCGADAKTAEIWQQIARKSEGQYASIDQAGGVLAIATPFDKEMGELADKMGKTLLAYGGGRDEARKMEGAAASAPSAEKADRVLCKAGGRLSTSDLVDAVREARVKVEDVKDDQLPDEMKKMTMEERGAFIEKTAKERDELKAKVTELAKQREAYIADELKKQGAKDSFDGVVKKMLREQGKKKGIEYGE